MFCIYCGLDRLPEDMTDEHVFPRALGGALEPSNPFKIQTCRKCNNRCGQFVDGPFSRSFRIHLARLAAEHSGTALTDDSTVPLGYMGHIKAWQGSGVCDFWIGPTGDSIYHFHETYDGDNTIVGRPIGPGRKTADPGIVFVGVLATNPAWHPIVVRSVEAEFPHATIYYINVSHQGIGPPYPPVPEELLSKLDWVKSLNGQKTDCQIFLDPYCGDRVTAKIGLGVGSLVLGRAFEKSEIASTLRRFMWARTPEARRDTGARGAAFSLFSRNRDMEALLAWRHCHTIALIPVGDHLLLCANLYGDHGMAVVLASQKEVWRSQISEAGKVWVVSPGLRRYVGPMSFPEFYIDARAPTPSGPLRQLAEQLDATPPWPPKHLDPPPVMTSTAKQNAAAK